MSQAPCDAMRSSNANEKQVFVFENRNEKLAANLRAYVDQKISSWTLNPLANENARKMTSNKKCQDVWTDACAPTSLLR